jgi:aspartate racemase
MAPRVDDRPLVGVLGGMGPAATADFYAKLVRRTPAGRDQDHLPVVIWGDPRVPDRVSSVRDGTDAAYLALLYGAHRLAEAGARLAAMPCHTAHFFLERLQADSGLRFVDMVAETVAAVATRQGRVSRAGLLATAGTLGSGLYQTRLADIGVEIVTPRPDVQRRVATAIAMVKRNDPGSARPLVEDAIGDLRDAGAQIVVLACTELPLALAGSSAPLGDTVLDPTDLLAAAVVRDWSALTAALVTANSG